MLRTCRFILILFVGLISAGCSHTVSSDIPIEPYQDSVYCFNGRSLVSRNGLWGIVGQDGRVILDTQWDSAEFLDDDIALLLRNNIYYLSTRDGRIYAQSPDSEALVSARQRLLAEVEEADFQKWDSVLDCLESLCDACLSSTARHPGDMILHKRDDLFARLADITGRPAPEQEERLEQIIKRFKAEYR